MNGDRTRRLAIYALTFISMVGIAGGIVIAYFGSPVGAVITIVAGAVAGIAAIATKDRE